jgi:large subunit ribosomal protein L9
MGKTIVIWKNIFLVLLFWKTLSITPVFGWLAASPNVTAKHRGGQRQLVVFPTNAAQPSHTALYKKKGGGGSSTTSSASKKIQVKLLKHVPGTGQAGEVILVSPAFFNNRLRPTSLAKEITNEQVEQERMAKSTKQQQDNELAIQMVERIEALKLTMKRKVGPNGHLFGGVGSKMVMEELYSAISDDFLRQKNVKITAMLDPEGKRLDGDIKTIGTFTATVSLTKEHDAQLKVIVEAEQC